MRLLFVMDPAHTMLPDKDTSFAFMEAAEARGHACFHCLVSDVGAEGARVTVRARRIRVARQSPFVALEDAEDFALESFQAVLIRKDPPFDAAYLHLTQVLDLCERGPFVMNEPRGLRLANEKLFALRFAAWMPRTLVSASPDAIVAFVQAEKQAVLKPLDGAGGSSVVRLTLGDKNVPALIDMLTLEGTRLAMVQRFEPSVEKGDKRVLLLGGKLLGAIRRVPQPSDFRANIHVGGQVELTALTEREQRLVEAVGPALVEAGLWFVGLDLIAEQLIEVNVTSPTGIQQLGRLGGGDPAGQVIRFLEERAQ
jgi:glutathione synthase